MTPAECRECARWNRLCRSLLTQAEDLAAALTAATATGGSK